MCGGDWLIVDKLEFEKPRCSSGSRKLFVRVTAALGQVISPSPTVVVRIGDLPSVRALPLVWVVSFSPRVTGMFSLSHDKGEGTRVGSMVIISYKTVEDVRQQWCGTHQLEEWDFEIELGRLGNSETKTGRSISESRKQY